MFENIPENDYLLLTPGPLSTSKRVRAAMLKDLCTWDNDYNSIVQDVRAKLLQIANLGSEYTTILMQGSGSFAVESVIQSALGSGAESKDSKKSKLLVLVNGEYGKRIATIAKRANIACECIIEEEQQILSVEKLRQKLAEDGAITHIAFVHCETTTGILNPLEELCAEVKKAGKVLIVDAMSSFGGVPLDIARLQIDFLISSANKCIQGVPGFGFIIAKIAALESCKGRSASLSLDIYEQWECMEQNNGKWRFTSPTHIVRAFREAISELLEEGGIEARFKRYTKSQKTLVEGMKRLGFRAYVPESLHSPIITTFLYPQKSGFTFKGFYEYLKRNGFVIYPGKLSNADTFRIGNIGALDYRDIERLLGHIEGYVKSLGAC